MPAKRTSGQLKSEDFRRVMAYTWATQKEQATTTLKKKVIEHNNNNNNNNNRLSGFLLFCVLVHDLRFALQN